MEPQVYPLHLHGPGKAKTNENHDYLVQMNSERGKPPQGIERS